jgi:hypothetical protein
MSNILYVIDGYLSSKDKADVTLELIQQLRKLDGSRKIMLINKFGNSWGIDTQVDFYREYLDGFMVGYPPEEIINSNLYNKPYVYYEVNSGILENWMPFVGVSDHVANVYNGFIYGIQEANKEGYSKVFRIEYDMLFDEEEFNEILSDLNKFEDEDYLIYGKRKEGKWAAQYQSLIDVHFCGYSNKIIGDFSFVKNDEEYWKLCREIGYSGKWAEYVLSMVFQYNSNENVVGKIYEGPIRNKFTKSQFDRISSSGEWTDKWKDIPKICKLDIGQGHEPEPTKLVIFYLNADYDIAEVDVVSNTGYYKHVELSRGFWCYEIIDRTDNMIFMSKVTHKDGSNVYLKKINDDNFELIKDRFILK